MIVERIEYVVNTTTRLVVNFWVQHWPLLLLTLWAVLSLWISFNLTGAVAVVTNAAVVITSFAGTVACLKVFRLERCFWIYLLAFLSIIFDSLDPIDATNIQKSLHLESLDFFLVWRFAEALQWTGVVILLSAGLYLLRFRHTAGYAAFIKIPLTIFFMCVFLQPVFFFLTLYMTMIIYDFRGLHM